jgi:hypothetical protein
MGRLDLAPLTHEAVGALVRRNRPVATVIAPPALPTERIRAVLEWKHLVSDAISMLEQSGATTGEVDAFVDVATQVSDEGCIGRGPGIALISPDRVYTFDTPSRSLVHVATSPAFARLFELAAPEPFDVLALSLHHTRMLSVTADGHAALDVPALPRRIDDVLRIDERQRHLGTHGALDVTTEHHHELDRFCRAVNDAIERWDPTHRRSIVIAAVGDLASRLRSVMHRTDRIAAVIEGSPDHRTDDDLVGAARAAFDEHVERVQRALVATGRRESLEQLAGAARAGRVDTLILPLNGEGRMEHAAVDRLVGDVLAHRGRVEVVPAEMISHALVVPRW